MSLVNYLGTYETLDQVWEAYPEGGKEGDYLYIASVLKKWNKYTSAWADPTEEDVEGSTIVSLEEDVVVGSSTLINYLGRFETLGDALNAYPEGGNEGDYIYVGDDIYAWDKYANEWVVSSDAPLEVAISEEDIIPNSNTFINYLGGFVDRDAVWQKYPEGGKVGDYLYIASDLHIWDKYICNWVAATPPDESSQIRPIEVLTQEGVVEYSENYINYLGVFESIEQAWEAYPEGGKEGDYIIVGGEQLRWNKYTSNWGEYDPDASTPARPVATIYGDLHVHNDVVIGEDLYARILETFTTKKWVLEQGYISMDDVTSELVMSKIVPDNTTIEVRDGKLVVIGGGSGGGSADSVAWDNITGKPDWIGDTKPTYTLDEIAGNNGDGFVTLLSNQTIEGVKNFANGAKFNGALLSYDEEKKTWVFPGNIIASGGITAFGSPSTPVASLFEALPIDGTTIKRDPVTNELYVDTNVVGGTGGGSLDEEQLEEYLKPYAKTADVANTYATKSSVNALSTQLNDFLSGSDTDTIINKWSELEKFLAGLAETDDLATILSGKANKATTLAGYGITDAYTKSHIDGNFVTIGTKQEITGEKDFVGGFKVNGGLVEYNATLKTWVFNGDLLVTGGMSAFSNISGFKPSTITEAVLIDNKTIKLNADGLLYAVAQETDGINEEQLADYLTANGYATQDWVTERGYFLASNFTKANIKSTLGISDWALASAKPSYSYSEISGTPTSLKNPNALSWSGFSSGSYDGSTAQNIALPTKLSQLTDDVVSGKYLSLTGGTISQSAYWSTKFKSTGQTSSAIAFEVANGNVGYLMYADGSKWQVTAQNWSATHTLLHSGNYSNYALPITGGTVNGNISLPNGNRLISPSGNIAGTRIFGDDTTNYRTILGTASLNTLLIGNSTLKFWKGAVSKEYEIIDTSMPSISFPKYIATGIGTTEQSGYKVTGNGVDVTFGANDATGGAYLWVSSYHALRLGTNGAERMRITAEGLVGIGNTNPVARLDVGGTILTTADLATTEWVSDTGQIKANCKGTSYWIGIGATSTGRAVIQGGNRGVGSIPLLLNPTAGNVAIGGTTASEKLHVYGNILATGGVTAQNSSDRRLKRNLRKFNASKVLMSLGAVWEYEYIDSEVQKNHIYEGTHYGLIYQHVKGTKLDVMCHEREDGMGALNYIHPKFISLIAGATMENISEVEKLKREIRHLKNKVKQLESRA